MLGKPTVKKIFVGLAISAIIILPLTSFAAEECQNVVETFSACVNKAFRNLSVAVGALISYVGAFLMTIAANLIQVLINLSTKVSSSVVVQEGFKITLSIANLGFVLAIIIIAFITMLRLQGYETKKMLRNLIIAAVLVNFSFAFTGTIMDFFNILSNYFLGASVGNFSSFEAYTHNLANALNTQSFVTTETNFFAGGVFEFAGAYFQLFASIAAVAIFNTVLVITFFATAFMLLIRYIALSILLIIMPIAWLFLIFPNLSGYWRQWWSEFLKWNFFLPAVLFFLFLSMVTSQKVGQIIGEEASKTEMIQAAQNLSIFTANTIVNILQAIVQVALVFGGLLIAQKIGIYGADGAMKMATGAKNWIIGATGRMARWPLTKPTSMAGTAISNWALKKGGAVERVASKIQNLPFIGRASAGLYNLAASRQAAVAALQKEEFGKDSDDAIWAKYNTFTTDSRRKAGLVNEIVKRGMREKAEKADPKRFDSYLEAAKTMGATKDIIENAPALAPKVMDFEKVFKEAVSRGVAKEGEEKTFKEVLFEEFATQMAMEKFRPSKTDELSPAEIEKVAKYFGQGHRERVAKEGSTAQLFAVAKAAERIRQTGETEHPLVQFSLNNPAMQKLALAPEYAEVLKTLKADIEAQSRLAEEVKRAAEARKEAEKAEAMRARGGRRQQAPTQPPRPQRPPTPPTPPPIPPTPPAP